LHDLESDRFESRQEAIASFQDMTTRPEMAGPLRDACQKALVASDTSLELRRQLEQLQRFLPKTADLPPDATPPEQLDRLVAQLEDNSYGKRLSAKRRLEWLLGNPRTAHAISGRLKERIGASDLSLDAEQWLCPLYDRARAVWILSNEIQALLPPVSDAQASAWLDAMCLPEANDSATLASHRRARMEFRDALTRDQDVARFRALIEAKLASAGLSPQAADRLKELLELTKPGMVAEFWAGGRLGNVQRLLVGVPSKSPQAERASYFDRIDDATAHCVSGQNLKPGDYAVGIAVPHPRMPGAFFHLINLTTPRRKMAYPEKGYPAMRPQLTAISRRTFDRILQSRRKVTPAEYVCFLQLDADELSRFSAKYFASIDDYRIGESPAENTVLPSPVMDPPVYVTQARVFTTHFGPLCELLAYRGTKEAVPGLLKAIDEKRFLAPEPPATPNARQTAKDDPRDAGDSPGNIQAGIVMPGGRALSLASQGLVKRWELIAALALADRDPWASVDDWLAGILDRSELLVSGAADAPQIGATAAAILLSRHGQKPADFGLRPSRLAVLNESEFVGYRFAADGNPNAVKQWWTKQRSKTPATPSVVK
jgi:hypothetical protein